jgi:NADH-quinone oxidoreductase subunit M
MGRIFLMLPHGIVSSALFFLIGALYDKYGSRNVYNYGGLVQPMPIFSSMLILFCFANTGLPGSCNFVGELTIFMALVDRSVFVMLLAATGII